MNDFQIINFNQQNKTNREATQMNNKVIALPANLDSLMSDLVVSVPRTSPVRAGITKPQGPKKPSSSKGHRGNTTYTQEFLAQVVEFLYTDLLTLKQICSILNHYGKTTAMGKTWTPSILNSVLDTREAWALIEPRWIKWQLDNSGLFTNED
jgi:hypothetical protein